MQWGGEWARGVHHIAPFSVKCRVCQLQPEPIAHISKAGAPWL